MSQCTEFLSQDPTVMERLHHNAGYLKKHRKDGDTPKRKGEHKRDEKTEEDQTWNQEEKQETILKTQREYSCENENILVRTRKWALESFPLETEKPSRESF